MKAIDVNFGHTWWRESRGVTRGGDSPTFVYRLRRGKSEVGRKVRRGSRWSTVLG